MRRLVLFLLAAVCLLAFKAAFSAPAEAWKVGFAKAKITPPAPMYLAGYGNRSAPAQGTLHDLWVKVVALEAADGHRAVVITTDVCGFSQKTYETICAELAKQCGLGRSQVMLTYSHTHTGPALDECLQDYCAWNDSERERIRCYTRWLENTIVQQAAAALARTQPSTLWVGQGTADFAVNRRNNKEADVPALRAGGQALKGPVDHSVPVLVIKSLEGRLQGVLFGYACHTTTLGFLQWSGDYAGFAMLNLERRHPGAQAMFFQGCGADQNPIPRHTVELCQQYGDKLAGAVDQTLAGRMQPVKPILRTAFEFVRLDFEKTMTAEDLRRYAAQGGLYGRWAERMLKRLEAGEVFPSSYPYAIAVWRFGLSLIHI